MNATSAHGRCFSVSRIFGVFTAIVAGLLIVSCDSPANNSLSGSARLELRLPEATTLSGRAVAGAGGYVYIRAIGGPSGAVGPLWGPISVSGKSVIISDIDPGEYSNILVLHAVEPLVEQTVPLPPVGTYEGGDAYFLEMLELPDDILSAYVSGAADDNVVMQQYLQGTGSYLLTGQITIKPGINALAATLLPACSADQRATLVQEGDRYDGGVSGETGRFFRVSFEALPAWSSVYFEAYTDGDDVPLSFYTSAGKRVGVVYSSSEDTYRGTVPISAFPLFVYKPSEHTNGTNFTAYEGGVPAEIGVSGGAGALANYSNVYMGMVTLGVTTSTQTLGINNDGTQPLVISSMAITGENPSSYSVSPAAPFTVPPKGERTITVTLHYTPPSEMKYAVLSLATNDADENPFVINLSGDVS